MSYTTHHLRERRRESAPVIDLAGSPDRLAYWAVLLGVVLIVVAALSA